MRSTKCHHLVELEAKGGIRKLTLDRGYYHIMIQGKKKRIHQLVAICFLNHLPSGMEIVVDHIDNNQLNNHVSNLQLTTNRNNSSKDRKTEFVGVDKSRNKFRARIHFKGRTIHLGTFSTPQKASRIYQEAVKAIENGTYMPKPAHVPTSQFRGVNWDKRTCKWRARYKEEHIGYYSTELEAYDRIKEYVGSNAINSK